MRCLLLLLFCACCQAVEVRAPSIGSCGSLLRWQLSAVPQQWLQNDCQITPELRITGPRKSIRTPCFLTRAVAWDGDTARFTSAPSLEARFLALEAGTYTWALLAPGGGPIQARGTMVIDAREATYGPLRRHPDNPHLLADQHGQAVIPIGPNIAWANTPDRLARIRHYLDALTTVGGTHFRLWCASWMGQIANPDGSPAFRLDQADLLDRVLMMAAERHLFVTLVIDNHHDYWHGKNGAFGASVQKRFEGFFAVPLAEPYRQRLDYLLARYSAHHHILAWELMNETDEGLRLSGYSSSYDERIQRSAAWIAAASTHIRARDPYQHLITSSCAYQEDQALIQHPELDLLQIHQYVPPLGQVEEKHKDGVAVLARHAMNLRSDGRPLLFAEVGFQGSNAHNSGHDVDPTGILLRQQAWAGLLLGGYGSGMNWWWDVYIDADDLWPIYEPLAASVALIDWDDPALRPLPWQVGRSVRLCGWTSPDQALLWPHLNANVWHLQVEQGRARYSDQLLRLSRLGPQRRYQATWIDPRDGSHLPGHPIDSDAEGQALLILPRGQAEGILHLQASGPAPAQPSADPQPPAPPRQDPRPDPPVVPDI